MSNLTETAGMVAGILTLLSFIPYIISILRKKTRPNRASWFIWTVVGFMCGASYYSAGASHTICVPVSYMIGPFFTAILSLKYGEGGWTRFDRGCLLVAGASLGLWWVFNSPLVALVINLIIDFMGALPTIRKSYYEPEKEDKTAWAMGFMGNTANLFAVERWSFAIAVYPVYMFIGCGIITALIFFRPRGQKRESSN